MEHNITKSLYNQSIVSYAYHKMVLDESGKPVDYIFLDVNHAFELQTGLKKADILNRSIREVTPDIGKDEFDWITAYGKLAMEGGTLEFEDYSGSLDKWYKVSAYSDEPLHFHVFFFEITAQKKERQRLELLAKTSEKFLQSPITDLDYSVFTDDLMKLTNAKFIAFNIIEANSTTLTTMAISGISDAISQTSRLLGFNLLGKRWGIYPSRYERIKDNIIYRFDNLLDLAEPTLPPKLVTMVQNTFKLGYIYLVRIMREEKEIGDFTLFMSAGEELVNEELVLLYAHQVGLLITRHLAEKTLKRKLETENMLTRLSSNFLNAREDNLTQVIDTNLNIIGQYTLANKCYLLVQEGAKANFCTVHEWTSLKDITHKTQFDPFDISKYPFFQSKLSERKPWIINSLRDIPLDAVLERDIFRKQKTKGAITIPIYMKEDLFAILGFLYYDESFGWDTSDLSLLNIIGDIFAGAFTRIETEKELRHSEERFRGYVEHSPESILVADQNGNLVYANEASSKITGYKLEELIGMNIASLLAPQTLERGMKHFQQVVSEGKAMDRLTFCTKDGSQKTCVVSAVNLSSERFIAFVSDISNLG